MRRRDFLRAAAAGAGSVALGFTLTRDAIGYPTRPGSGPYSRLQPPDRNGVWLPKGFTSRVVARTGRRVAGTSHVWHGAPDGGACFPDGSAWIYVSNAELGGGAGGASAVTFDSAARITGAYPILDGTNRNCAGGATPWGSWLSCEEVDRGFVYETDPRGGARAARRPAMGRFQHEAAAADPDRQVIYLTEDEPDGCFYRFQPDTWE
ncbi:MAG: DUF839 domain-containing protein, partial [Micromonosporaceae bacterium]|nr:DUF839 domain-containing protein [Micromonosporaceae bacterium]